LAFRSAYLIRPPLAYRWLYSAAVFRKNPAEKKVYLTFDDGPNPEATSIALGVLEKHGVKATFFLLGKNAKKHPEIVALIQAKGHQIGNHGMIHLSGWQTSTGDYIEDMKQGKAETSSNLFRPAYGKLSLPQYRQIKQTEQIVLWDIISGDFDPSINADKVYYNVTKNARNGSIIVMHDSPKALPNMQGSLNRIITELKKNGYGFGLL
jgi:peptidoglycan/xylan/chitin deacetylase (PgdA/CDA1 family)